MSQTSIEGGCLCGRIRYHALLENPQTMACYCRDCQQATGSPMAAFVGVPQALLEHEGDFPKGYTKEGDSGRSVTRYFCDECGSQLYSSVEVVPDVYFVKLGTLDDSESLAPQAHIWTKSKPSWCALPDGAIEFETNPPA